MKLQLILTLALLIGLAGAIEIKPSQINWSQSLPSGEGIVFSGTAPGTTTNTLYSDSGTLMFNGSAIGSSDVAYAVDYGVIANDSTDDSTALQAAIDSGYHIIELPGGTIDIDNTTIDVGADTIVRGMGRGSTILDLSGTLAYINVTANRVRLQDFMMLSDDFSARYGVRISGVSDWRLENLWIKGIGANGTWGTYQGYGIYVADSSWIGQIENCLCEWCFIGGYIGSAANDVQIISSRFTYSTQDGIYTEADNTHGLSVYGCDFEGNGRHGLLLSKVEQATVWGSYFELNDYSGIWMDGGSIANSCGIISVYGSTFYANGASNAVPSIEMWWVNRSVVSGCRFAGDHSAKGAIEISGDPLGSNTDLKVATLIENRYDEMGSGDPYVTNPQYAVIIDSRRQGGTTGHRPAAPAKYETYFDSTLGKLIVYSGSGWIDVDGTAI